MNMAREGGIGWGGVVMVTVIVLLPLPSSYIGVIVLFGEDNAWRGPMSLN